jgi:DNA-binding NarL/FixJ family response regulator
MSATGLSITEVAERPGQPSDTVRGHFASVVRKLGARSKIEVVMIALRYGLIDLVA